MDPGNGDPLPGARIRRQALATQQAGAKVHLLRLRRPALLALALARLRGGFDIVHAHEAVPAGEAALHALRLLRRPDTPLVVSIHGEDVLDATRRFAPGSQAIEQTLLSARLTLAGSSGIAALASEMGVGQTRVVHPGTDLPEPAAPARQDPPTLVTVGHLVPHKRHADVLRVLAVLRERHPKLRYAIIGEGPERATLEGLARRLGVDDRVELLGALDLAAARERLRHCSLFVMPSTEEEFGIAYIEAMAAGLPAVGCRGEPGPEEIAAAGSGFVLVPPGDVERLSQRIDELLSDRERLRAEGRHARRTVAASFTWERCGRETVEAYEAALR
ncbi:MAG TPA: glycosyltransferase family 4 protein [Solirubrobacteraceae bacterium]